MALAGVADRDMGRDFAANQPTKETACAISRISGEALRLQVKTPLRSSEHRFCRLDLVVGPRGRWLDINDDGILYNR